MGAAACLHAMSKNKFVIPVVKHGAFSAMFVSLWLCGTRERQRKGSPMQEDHYSMLVYIAVSHCQSAGIGYLAFSGRQGDAAPRHLLSFRCDSSPSAARGTL